MWAIALALALAAAPAQRALEVLRKHECNRCHVVESTAPPPLKRSCAGCHLDLASAADDEAKLQRGLERYGEAYRRFIARTSERYVALPALVSMNRFRADWLRAFLRAPYDLRPELAESMIRHNLSAEEIEELIAGWGAREGTDPSTPPTAARLEIGALVFEEQRCASCHAFGNRRFAATVQAPWRARALAPDLRHVRHRMDRDVLLATLADPKSVNPAAQMPTFELTFAERELLADFLLYAEPGTPAPPTPPAVAAPSTEPVHYEDVEREVFKKVCWHCHSDPRRNGGDGGPGNTGGFGFRRTGLSFASHADVLRGSVDAQGRAQSIFRMGSSGEPVLLQRLRARQRENARDHVLPGQDDLRDRRTDSLESERGMPLGLPALSDAQIELVERWIQQGMPGP